MKQTIHILIIAIGLSSCNRHIKLVDKTTIPKSDSNVKENLSGALNKDYSLSNNDSIFYDLKFDAKEISKDKYQDIEKKLIRTCSIDTSGFVKGKGLILEHFCKDICELYLIDEKKKIKLMLPSNFDGGITGLVISPDCNQFFVYSSYDSADYTKFYENRAEVYGFAIAKGQGIQTIKPTFKFYTKNWSIENVIWISNNEIALKVYEESRSAENQDKLNYKYFKSTIKK